MKTKYINIYNNLVKLTRNKKLYIKLEKKDTFSERLTILFFHFGFFLKIYKFDISKKEKQSIFDHVIIQIELSIREIGYGDISVNKKMKQYINLFYSVIEKVEYWDTYNNSKKMLLISNYLHIEKNLLFFVDYFEKYLTFLSKNSLNMFSKDILDLKF